jgi:hypothetical protein
MDMTQESDLELVMRKLQSKDEDEETKTSLCCLLGDLMRDHPSSRNMTADISAAVCAAMRQHPNHTQLNLQAGTFFQDVCRLTSLGDLHAMAEKGVPEQIVASMSKHSTDARIQATGCCVLGLLCREPAVPESTATRGVIPAILRAMKAHQNEREVQTAGVLCLYRLIGTSTEYTHGKSERLKAVVKGGGISAVVDTMRNFANDLEIQFFCCVFMCESSAGASSDPVQQMSVREMWRANVIPHVLGAMSLLLRSDMNLQQAAGSISELKASMYKVIVVLYACQVISIDARNMQIGSHDTSAGLSVILRCMATHMECPDLTLQALNAIVCYIIPNLENVKAAGKETMKAIIQSLDVHKQVANVVDIALKAIRILIDKEQFKACASELGAMQVIVPAMSIHKHVTSIQKYACAILNRMVRTDDAEESSILFEACGGLPAILTTVKVYCHDSEIQEQASGVLFAFSRTQNPNLKAALTSQESADAVLCALEANNTAGITESAVEANRRDHIAIKHTFTLYFILCDAEKHDYIDTIVFGMMSRVVQELATSLRKRPPARAAVSTLLQLLSSNRDFVAEFLKADGIRAVAECIRAERSNSDVLMLLFMVLANSVQICRRMFCSRHKEIQKLCRDEGAIEAAVICIVQHANERMVADAALFAVPILVNNNEESIAQLERAVQTHVLAPGSLSVSACGQGAAGSGTNASSETTSDALGRDVAEVQAGQVHDYDRFQARVESMKACLAEYLRNPRLESLAQQPQSAGPSAHGKLEHSMRVGSDMAARSGVPYAKRKTCQVCAVCSLSVGERGVKKLFRCSACTLAPVYCSPACQQAGWKGHKEECKKNKKTAK